MMLIMNMIYEILGIRPSLPKSGFDALQMDFGMDSWQIGRLLPFSLPLPFAFCLFGHACYHSQPKPTQEQKLKYRPFMHGDSTPITQLPVASCQMLDSN